MALGAGARLGPYEILRLIGAGGMGEVYQAQDLRLGRVVAIKLLPSALATDSEFRQRFDREARAISQLTHPNICVLHDIVHEPSDSTRPEISFLVLEYLEGETLATRLSRGALPMAQALASAAQIADALNHAHRRGIVHRDLKPGNIMLTNGGVKLLDFGLAKLQSAGAHGTPESTGPTLTAALTATGAILGTVQYMAPEQLEGREADARTDIFAFGTVVHEMVTGRKAFEGKSQASVIAAILEREPPRLSELQPLTPPGLDHIVRRCLAKDPDERWQSSRDLFLELTSLSAGRASPGVHHPKTRWKRDAAIASAGAIIGALLVSIIAWRMTARGITTPVRPARFVVGSVRTPPPPVLTISPDGSRVVFVMPGDALLYIRPLDQSESVAIPGTEGAVMPFFSPDGQWLGFFAQSKLKKVQLDGRAPTTICDAPEPRGGAWGADGTIVFAAAPFSGLSRVSSEGGKPEQLTRLEASRGELSHRWPTSLPDGSGVVYTVGYAPRSSFNQGDLALYSFRTGMSRVILQGGSFPRIVRPGYLLFTRGQSLMAAPFDLAQQSVTGREMVVESSITAFTGWGSAQVALSDEGTLAFVPAAGETERQLLWIDRNGREEALPLKPGAFSRPRVSPDGRHILVIVRGPTPAVWAYDTARGVFSAQAELKWESPNTLWSPAVTWSPDGRMFAYTTDEGTEWKLWRKRIDNSAAEEMLHREPMQFAPTSWSPDGRTLAVDEVNLKTRIDVMLLQVGESGALAPFVHAETAEENGRFSPDGRWLAYDAGMQTPEVYVRAFPGPGPIVQVSSGKGVMPVWAPDGRELFYWTSAGIMGVPISSRAEVSAGAPRLLVRGDFSEEYDVSPDGRRFLVMKRHGTAPPPQLQVVTGWLDHLRAALGPAEANR